MEVGGGFVNTDIGVLPNHWKIELIKTISSVRTGPFGSALHESDYVDDGTPIITVEHLGDRGIEHKNLPMVSDKDKRRLDSYILFENDIVFSRVGSVDRNALVRNAEKGWLFSGRLLRLRIQNKNIYPAYLSHYFKTEEFKTRIRSVAVGQTMASLNTDILNGMLVAIPPYQEQRAIAEALSDVDALISSLDALIAKKRAIKQGLMQELLTGKRRLPGFNGKWEQVRLGDIGFTYGGLSSKSKEDFEDGNFPYIPFLNILSNPVINIDYFDYVKIAPNEKQNATKLGDLFFNGSSETPEEVGMCSVLLQEMPDLFLNSFCFGFRPFPKSDYYGLFLAYLFRSSVGRKYLNSLAQGATRYNLSKNSFLKLQVNLPTHNEQLAISEVISSIDYEISLLERRKEKTMIIKQGMMQQLLTGRIRLIGV